MIEDLIKLKNQIDTMIETYRDLHPDEEDENYHLGRGHWETHDRGNNTHLDGMSEYNEKQRALKRIREGYYENTFRQEQGKTTTEFSQGQIEKCVLDDT